MKDFFYERIMNESTIPFRSSSTFSSF